MLADLKRDDLEVWGFDGVPSVVCSTSLPSVRHKPSDRFFALSVARRGGPAWSSRCEIEEHLREGRVSRLTMPLVLPEPLFPLTPAGQPLVAWAKPEFWWSVLLEKDEEKISWHTGDLEWEHQMVERAASVPAGSPGSPTTYERPLWLACASKADVEIDLDGWARICRGNYDERLVMVAPDWHELERLADYGLCACRTPATRYSLYVRYGAAMYFRSVSPLERCSQLFRVLVKNEFPTVDWERFRADMVAIVARSRDLLRFEVETASVLTSGERVAQPSGAQVGLQQRAIPIPRP